MPVQPVPLQGFRGHAGRTTDPPLALLRPTGTLKGLIHVPLGAGVEEGKCVADFQWLLVDHAHFHAGHIEDETGRAGMVTEDQVRVELDVAIAAGLDAGVGPLGRGGAGDLGEERARGEFDEGLGAAGECLGAAVDVETVGMGRRGQFGAQGRHGGERFSRGGHLEKERRGGGGGGGVVVVVVIQSRRVEGFILSLRFSLQPRESSPFENSVSEWLSLGLGLWSLQFSSLPSPETQEAQ